MALDLRGVGVGGEESGEKTGSFVPFKLSKHRKWSLRVSVNSLNTRAEKSIF